MKSNSQYSIQTTSLHVQALRPVLFLGSNINTMIVTYSTEDHPRCNHWRYYLVTQSERSTARIVLRLLLSLCYIDLAMPLPSSAGAGMLRSQQRRRWLPAGGEGRPRATIVGELWESPSNGSLSGPSHRSVSDENRFFDPPKTVVGVDEY
jgi:hypothetical protein